LSIYRETLSKPELIRALRIKATERDSVSYIDNHLKYLQDIAGSPEIAKIWMAYANNYPYAKNISLPDILDSIAWVFE